MHARSTSSPPGPCAATPGSAGGSTSSPVKRLAGSPFEPTARLGLELAVERFDPENPDPELVLVLADSPLAEARRQAVGVGRGALGSAPHATPGSWSASSPARSPRPAPLARDLLRKTALPDAEAEPLVARLVARLLDLGADDEPARRATSPRRCCSSSARSSAGSASR